MTCWRPWQRGSRRRRACDHACPAPLAGVSEPAIRLGYCEVPVRLSAGVAFAGGSEAPEDVLRDARAALTQARMCSITRYARGSSGGTGPDRVSVNLSLRQIAAGSLPGIVERCLEDTGADPDALWLELTETAAKTDIEATADVLDRLRALGIHLALDDFGTGWSSLSWLGALPVELVKIDRSYVSGIDRDPRRRRVAAASCGPAPTRS